MTINYSEAGPLTSLHAVDAAALAPMPFDPKGICAPVHALVIQPTDPDAAGLSAERGRENQIRPAGVLVERLLALDPAPVTEVRTPDKRVVGTCRHFAVLSCALLRHRGVEARARCGFATYFRPGHGVDHWITEYRDATTGRWVRIDTEILSHGIIDRPQDLSSEQFLSGGEAWAAWRRGDIDAARFGVHGTQNWGPSEIRGNAVRDLAALNKIEMLPWDEWGRMTDAYNNTTGPDYDSLLDELADGCAADDPSAIEQLYGHPDLRVPDHLVG